MPMRPGPFIGTTISSSDARSACSTYQTHDLLIRIVVEAKEAKATEQVTLLR